LKTAFVTGATGFLGLNLVEQLCAAGWRVLVFHRSSSDLTRLRAFSVERASGNLHEADEVAAAMPQGVDAVFHLAANTTNWSRRAKEQIRDNVEGTRAVVEAALRRRAHRFVHTSTWNVYGLWQPELHEGCPQLGNRSKSSYDRTKWKAEQEVKAAVGRGLEAVVLNPAHILGRYDTHNWARLIRLACAGRLPAIPPGGGTFAHGAEVARAHIVAAERGRTGENYLLGGVDATFAEIVAIVGELSGRKMPRLRIPPFVSRALARANVMVAALTGRTPDYTPGDIMTVLGRGRIRSNKAADELGYRVVPLRDMVEDSYRWLEHNGLLSI
jgi:dihydroflavonol-4-reductase